MLNYRNIKITKLNKFLNYKNIKSFKIVRVINKSTYKFDLFNIMKNVFSIFYFLLLYNIIDNFLFK